MKKIIVGLILFLLNLNVWAGVITITNENCNAELLVHIYGRLGESYSPECDVKNWTGGESGVNLNWRLLANKTSAKAEVTDKNCIWAIDPDTHNMDQIGTGYKFKSGATVICKGGQNCKCQ